MNTTEYAKHAGVSQPQVSKWIRDGILKKSVEKVRGRYQINAKIADKERKANTDPIRGGKRTKKKNTTTKTKTAKRKKSPTKKEKQKTIAQAKTAGIDFNEARRLNEQYKAALKKLDYDERSKKVIELAKVRKTLFEIGRQVKDGCLSIPDRCAPLVASTEDIHECKQILSREITYILENLANAVSAIK